MNRPYIDDKLIHFGFSLGMNFMSYSVTESGVPVSGLIEGKTFTNQMIHPRVSTVIPGFSVGFITDLRLARYLNLRFTPELHFSERSLSYRFNEDAVADDGSPLGKMTLKTNMRSIPISVPLMLKWSADREGNYRPYVIGGGGISFDFGPDRNQYVLQKPLDYFVQVGFGCDFYFRWFKFCPELKYQLGFNNVLTPLDEHTEVNADSEGFYTNSISRLRSHVITLVFNFE